MPSHMPQPAVPFALSPSCPFTDRRNPCLGRCLSFQSPPTTPKQSSSPHSWIMVLGVMGTEVRNSVTVVSERPQDLWVASFQLCKNAFHIFSLTAFCSALSTCLALFLSPEFLHFCWIVLFLLTACTSVMPYLWGLATECVLWSRGQWWWSGFPWAWRTADQLSRNAVFPAVVCTYK